MGTEKTLLNRHPQIPNDATLPGLATLLCVEKVAGPVGSRLTTHGSRIKSFSIEYIRYKPGTNCVATYRLTIIDPVLGEEYELVLFGKSYTAADFDQAVEKLYSRVKHECAVLDSAIVLHEDKIIIDEMANDPQLNSLRTVFDSRKLRRLLYRLVPDYPADQWRLSHKRLQVKVIRYKPEKRAVIRLETVATNLESTAKHPVVIYVRCYSDERGAEIFERMLELSNSFKADERVRTPRPFAYLAEENMLIVESQEGEPFLEWLEAHDQATCMERAAEALAHLHCSAKVRLPNKSMRTVLEEVGATASTLKTFVPEQEELIGGIYDSLASRLTNSPDSVGPVHGDFHHGQILVQPDRSILLDFDRSYEGDPMADLGNFCAHLYLLEMRGLRMKADTAVDHFIRSYSKFSGRSVDRQCLNLWMSLGILMLAVHPFRTLQEDWHQQTCHLLQFCSEKLT